MLDSVSLVGIVAVVLNQQVADECLAVLLVKN